MDDVAVSTVDFERQIQPIFDAHCGCHLTVAAPEGSTLLANASFDALVNVPSTQDPDTLRVRPGDPDNSYLVIKIDDRVPDATDRRLGVRMPTGVPPLSIAEIDLIRLWISEGAQRTAGSEDETDTEPPQFAGVTTAIARSPTEIDLSWEEADDDQTAHADITYRVFIATQPGAHNFAQPSRTVRSVTQVRVDFLDPGTIYFFVVRAVDATGNEDANRTEIDARTFDPPTPQFLRGDLNDDGRIDQSDTVFAFDYLLASGPAPACLQVADANGDSSVNLADAAFILRYLFDGGDEPPPLSEDEIEACQGEQANAVQRGMEVYNQPDPGGNTYACSTCHATVPEGESELRQPGYTLYDALRRPSYKLGQLSTFLEAANDCRNKWMRTTPWGPSSRSFLNLVAFLESISPTEDAPALVYEIVEPAIQGPTTTGDAQSGCTLYHTSCVICHGPNGFGSERGSPLISQFLSADFIRQKVRLSGPRRRVYDGLLGGVMPFWTEGKLTTEELENLVAYILSDPRPTCSGGDGDL